MQAQVSWCDAKRGEILIIRLWSSQQPVPRGSVFDEPPVCQTASGGAKLTILQNSGCRLDCQKLRQTVLAGMYVALELQFRDTCR